MNTTKIDCTPKPTTAEKGDIYKDYDGGAYIIAQTVTGGFVATSLTDGHFWSSRVAETPEGAVKNLTFVKRNATITIS